MKALMRVDGAKYVWQDNSKCQAVVSAYLDGKRACCTCMLFSSTVIFMKVPKYYCRFITLCINCILSYLNIFKELNFVHKL